MNAIAAISPQELLASLNWRYAVKKFEPRGRVPEAAWKALEEALVLSPSSFGLQPWKFFVVDDPALRAELKAASWGQSQVIDADKLVVFAVKKDFGAADILRYVARIAEVRGIPVESLKGYQDVMLNTMAGRPTETWAARQVYIALGNFLTAAALLGVDACPMEGIEQAKYDDLLRLPEQGYKTLFVAAAGVRAGDDKYAGAPKVRFAHEDVVAHI